MIIGQDTFLTAYVLTLAALLGAVFGSFINCLAYRLAHGQSVMKGRSRCTSCGHELGAADLVPVFSYIFLRGKCRYCGEKLSPRYFITEIMLAAAFLIIVYKFDVSLVALEYLVLVCLLLGASLVDLEIYEIPDRFIICGIVNWLIFLPLTGWQWKSGLLGAFIIGSGMLLLSSVFDKITGKESLGGGDIKLFFMTGLYLGPAVGLFNLILSCIAGIFFVIVMKQKRIPFGPAISLAVFVSLIIGTEAVDWYLGLFYL